MKLKTLKKNKEFSLVYRRGKSFATKHLVLVFLKKRYGDLRFGFSISKKIGKSVVRNKVRRRIKEAIGKQKEMIDFDKSYDLILIARNPIVDVAFENLEKDIVYLLKKADILILERINKI